MTNMYANKSSTPLIFKKISTRRRLAKAAIILSALLILSGLGGAGWLFLSPAGLSLRNLLADSLLTSRHRQWAEVFIGKQAMERRISDYRRRFAVMSANHEPNPVHIHIQPHLKTLYKVVPVARDGYKGDLVYIYDPRKLRVCVPAKSGAGETVSGMVKRTKAILGVNAGGFVDPDLRGNGFQPAGIIMSGGRIFYNSGGDKPEDIVGIDKRGILIAGRYRASQLRKMGVREAVTFAPRFIEDGKGLIKDEAHGWGIAPRTAIAQKADGTIILAVIDGRHPGYSLGASLYDLQNLLLQKGAVTAANLDGGSSTELVERDKIMIAPRPFGERKLPSAFLLYKHPGQADIHNPW